MLSMLNFLLNVFPPSIVFVMRWCVQNLKYDGICHAFFNLRSVTGKVSQQVCYFCSFLEIKTAVK